MFVSPPGHQLCSAHVGRAVMLKSPSTCGAQHLQLTFGRKLTSFQKIKNQKSWSSARFSHRLKCSSTTTGGLLLTDWPEDKRRSRREQSPPASTNALRDSRRGFGDSWGQDSPSFVFLCSPRSFCSDRSSRDRCSYTTVGAGTGELQGTTQTPKPSPHPLPTFILLPGAGRGHWAAGCGCS